MNKILSLFVFILMLLPLHVFSHSDGEKFKRCLAEHGVNKNILSLDHCELNDSDITHVTTYLKKHPLISHVILDDNELGLDAAIELAKIKTIKTLWVQRNRIDSNGATALSKSRTLRELAMTSNQVDDRGAIALSRNKFLTSLSLLYNPIGEEGLTALATSRTLKGLRVGSLQDINLDAIDLLLKNNKLKLLHLAYRNIGENEVSAIASMPNLEFLGFSSTNISRQAVMSIAANNQLKGLILENCALGDEEVAIIASMPFLKYISLSNEPNFGMPTSLENQIGNDGAASLARSKSLLELDLAHNQIGDDGAIAFANVEHQINIMDLSYNQITKIGLNELAKNNNILLLITKGNPGYDGRLRCKNFHCLYLNKRAIGEKHEKISTYRF